jgi:hypothetical protein
MTRTRIGVIVGNALALVCLAAALASAQTTTSTETKKFEIISVEGNKLVVRLPEGTREMTVADDFRFNIDGKMMSVRELKAGMTGTATVTTKTTLVPVTVTEVKSGVVTQTLGGSTIIVRTDEGYKMFNQGDVDKRNVTIMRNGKPAQISDFRVNEKLSALIITSAPPRTLTEQEVKASLARSGGSAASSAAAPAPARSNAGAATAKPAASPQPAAAPSGEKPTPLPRTASPLPLLGLVGLASLMTGLGLTVVRRRLTR